MPKTSYIDLSKFPVQKRNLYGRPAVFSYHSGWKCASDGRGLAITKGVSRVQYPSASYKQWIRKESAPGAGIPKFAGKSTVTGLRKLLKEAIGVAAEKQHVVIARGSVYFDARRIRRYLRAVRGYTEVRFWVGKNVNGHALYLDGGTWRIVVMEFRVNGSERFFVLSDDGAAGRKAA